MDGRAFTVAAVNESMCSHNPGHGTNVTGSYS